MMKITAAAAIMLAAGNAQADLGESSAAAHKHYGPAVKIVNPLAGYTVEWYQPSADLWICQAYSGDRAVIVTYFFSHPRQTVTNERIVALDLLNTPRDAQWQMAKGGGWRSQDGEFEIFDGDEDADGTISRSYFFVPLAKHLIEAGSFN